MKYCPECGAVLPGNRQFCLLCRAPIAQAAVPAVPSRHQAPLRQAHATRGGGLLLAAGLALVVLLLGYGVFPALEQRIGVGAPPPTRTPGPVKATRVVALAVPTVALYPTDAPPVPTPSTDAVRTATLVPKATRAPTVTSPATATLLPTPMNVPPTATLHAIPVVIPQTAQSIQVSNIRYTVLSVEPDGQQITSPATSYTTEGMYLRVRLQEEAIGKDPQTAFFPNLIDSQQRTFMPLTSTQVVGFVPDNERCAELSTLQPNAPVVCQYIYEVAKDATGLQLRALPYVEPGVAVALVPLTVVVPSTGASVPALIVPTATRVPPVVSPTEATAPPRTVPMATSVATVSPTPSVTTGIRVGAVCSDGSRSLATGPRACVQHGGVKHWILFPPRSS